ncbi:MAG TPA: DUF885 domain-containing protein [Anaerolineales bacterium]|nr:DUF885 domain-containing protein [Anaerolineales bacterium]
MSDPNTPESHLHALFREEWESHLKADPFFASVIGDRRYNDRLPEATEEAFARQADDLRRFLGRLEKIERAALSEADRLNYDIFRRLKTDALRELEFPVYRMPLDRLESYHTFFADLTSLVSFDEVEDYEAYLSRLAGFSMYSDGKIEMMREGLRSGWTQPRRALEGMEKSMDSFLVDDPRKSVFQAPLEDFPESVNGAARSRLQEEVMRVVGESVIPAYRRLLTFFEEEYLPGCRTDIGASGLPDGRQFYEHRVRMNVSFDTSPEEVHAIGLKEVDRIREEMEALRKQVDFPGDHAAFGDFLRTDPRFYAESPDQLMKEVAFVLKRMDGELPGLFGRLPRLPYGIKPIPDYQAPHTTTAYYRGGSGDGTRAGCYYVNTYDLKSRPLYEIEALSLHEAVPGHHLQIALQQELSDLPEFRRFEGFTAFVEGWGLYAERLGLEVGFYTDPYSDYGRLTYEMWRACRLVVDTGMHAFGWTRQQAVDFMVEHTALTELNVRNEVDRYITWPGQALAYKMGELKIRELRARAEKALGGDFDVRAFHDVVLRDGAVPLDVLEGKIETWLEAGR